MDREILFRGKSISTGEWIEGNFIHRKQGLEYIRNNDSLLKVDPATVGQFTGLYDDKRRKVFEGDIIDVRGRFKSEVRYVSHNAGYLVKDNYGDWQWLYDVLASMFCEVIGNIHDTQNIGKKECSVQEEE